MSDSPARALLEVDALEVQVIVDNVTDSLSTVPAGVVNENAVLVQHGLTLMSGEAKCCAHHGLSLVITATLGSDRQVLLFDAGPEAYTVTRNGALLGVPFGSVGAVALSHGHWDHAGGLAEAIRLVVANNGGAALPCHVNPGMFVSRANTRPDGSYQPYKDIPGPRELAASGATVVNAPEARLLLERTFYLSGEIPRVTPYERGYPGHVKRSADGRSWEPDPWLMDERYVAAHVKGKGVVVFTACSHAGVVNVLKDARAAFDGVPLHAVMGGFHLAGATVQPAIAETVRDLREFGLKRIAPAHCTGWRAVHAMAQVFPDDVLVPSAVGRKYLF
jgi:7,8-dihydropterin-6-yl-methyl-4-(beta-D-ribofuranosyl)aminobenzene 5'-phosphate synthase